MKKYLAKKLLLLIPLLLGVTSLTFTLTKALPGDPVFSMVGERAQPEVIEKMRREIGSDRSIFIQYIGYVKLLLRGDFGRSYYTNRKVLDDLLQPQAQTPSSFGYREYAISYSPFNNSRPPCCCNPYKSYQGYTRGDIYHAVCHYGKGKRNKGVQSKFSACIEECTHTSCDGNRT